VCCEVDTCYLWIDSLCMVQDDVSDWKRESAIMGRIYQQSFVTLAAASASNSSGGLFDVRRPPKTTELPYHDIEGGGRDGTLLAYLEDDTQIHWDTLKRTPLGKRGWIMQEFLLSRRIVHFTDQGLAFTCWGDTGPSGPASFRTEFGEYDLEQQVDSWQEVVMDYTSRELTFQSDKLAAVEGMARSFARRDNYQYYYGMFLDLFPLGLIWETDARCPVTRTCTKGEIPSWSWASRSCPVTTPYSLVHEMPHDWRSDGICNLVDACHETVPGGLRVRGALRQVTTHGDTARCPALATPHRMTFEEVQSARTTCSTTSLGSGVGMAGSCGCLRAATISANPTTEFEGIFILKSPEEGLDIGWGRFDDGGSASGTLYILPIFRVDSEEMEHVARNGLPAVKTSEPSRWWSLLVQRGSVPATYQRVGFGEVQVRQWMHDLTLEEICLT